MRIYQKKLFAVLLAIAGASLSAEESGEQWDKVYAKVKAHLMLEFTAIDDTERSSAAWIKQNLGASDEQIRKAMMDIHREAVLMHSNEPEQDSRSLNRMRIEGSIRELGGCADSQAKDFLLDYAATKKNDPYIRSLAVSSYLRAADAEEAKAVLLRFLVGEERMDDYSRSSLYVYAKDVWDVSSLGKKVAIFQALCEAASSESPQWVFEECDSRLLLMDPAWRESSRRESMLRRQLSLPFSKYYTELKIQMEKEIERIEKAKKHSVISTNLVALAAQDFSPPYPDGVTNGAKGYVHEGPGTEPITGDAAGRISGTYILFGVSALILLGIGAWRFFAKMKRHSGNRERR